MLNTSHVPTKDSVTFGTPAFSNAVRLVSEFAKLTGDYKALSATDIRVIALAHTLLVERKETKGLRDKPRAPIVYILP